MPEYKPYVEAKYHDDFDDHLAQVAAEQKMMAEMAGDLAGFFAEFSDVTNQCRWADSAGRLEELEENGVVSEVLFPGVNTECAVPWSDFFNAGGSRVRTPRERELKWAGESAYNRWLEDFCADTPNRRIGLAFLPVHDVDAAVAEIHRASDAGLRGMLFSSFNYDLPEYTVNEYWEPIWAACEEVGFSLNSHGGCGLPDLGAGRSLLPLEHLFFASRPVWHLIFAGVFDRHPNLRFTLTESYAAWVPDTLERLDSLHADGVTSGFGSFIWPERKPSEYWGENLFVGTSLVSLPEIEARHEIGVDSMMYGIDYPHPEGAWGQSRTWIQASLGKAGITEAEARAILGENACRCYGLDAGELAVVAERVGPTIEEVLSVASDEEIAKLIADLDAGGRSIAARNYETVMKAGSSGLT
jgi:predicted TIM-barrel fold metal-dependent hydrolase